MLAALSFVLVLSTFAVPDNTYALPQMSSRFVRLSNAGVGATSTHVVGFTVTQLATPLGSVEIEYCSNSPVPGAACTAPAGFSLSGATLAAQTGNTGFVIDPSSTVNKLVIGRFPIIPVGGASTYQLNNVINPSSTGSYYIRLRTFSSNDGTGSPVEEGGIAFAINAGINITTEVPPYLKFCTSTTISGFDCSTATSFFIDLGEFSSSNATVASSQFVVATNAANGLTITAAGTTLISGNNSIPEIAAVGPSSPGTSQFGINLRQNSSPGIGAEPTGSGTVTASSDYNTPNQFKYASNSSIASTTITSDVMKFTISYVANVSTSQQPGVYATTLSFICLANF